MYTTENKIAKYLGVDITAGDAIPYIESAQRYIEQSTQRRFEADTVATARLYNGSARQDLSIDPCVEVTKVEIGSNAYGDSFTEVTNETQNNYFLLPNNYASLRRPINAIGLRNDVFIWGHANHRITAKWGYSAVVPDDIEFVATVLSSGMYYENLGNNTGAIKSEKIGNYSVSYADNKGVSDAEVAQEILSKYKLYSI